MEKHGVLIVTETPALPWDLIFHLERACKNYLIALFHHLAFNSLLAELASRAFATASAAELLVLGSLADLGQKRSQRGPDSANLPFEARYKVRGRDGLRSGG